LRCYVVIELKAEKLTLKNVGQLDFYLPAVDGELKRDINALTSRNLPKIEPIETSLSGELGSKSKVDSDTKKHSFDL